MFKALVSISTTKKRQKQKLIISQFWRLEVQIKVSAGPGSL
jgi:hypothetical protein